MVDKNQVRVSPIRGLTDLKRQFLQSLDVAVIRSLANDSRIPNGWRLLGEGMHFRSYLLQEVDMTEAAVRPVVSIAKPGFCRGLAAEQDRWLAAMAQLSTCQHVLIPPLFAARYEDVCLYAKPYCSEPIKLTDNAEVSDLWQSLQNVLAERRLELDDYPQIAACFGHPFVIDWSDLKWCQWMSSSGEPRRYY